MGKRGRGARPVERRRGARGRRGALARARRVSRYEPPWPSSNKAERLLSRALSRAPFRVQGIWRAAKEGAELKSARFDGRPLWCAGALARDARQKSPRRKGGDRRGVLGVLGELDREDPRARGERKSAARALWEALKKSGADPFERDEFGDGFERLALSSPWAWRRAEALLWWKSVGGGPHRAHPGVNNLAELCVAQGAQGLEQLQEAWPRECSWEALDEALGRAGLLREARVSELMAARGRENVRFPSWLRESSLEMAAEKIVRERPWAVRPDRSLSQAIRRSGGRWADEIEALESAAIARVEKEAMEGEIGAAWRPVGRRARAL